MNSTDKLKALGEISPEYVDSAAKAGRRRPFRAFAIAAAALAAACGAFFAVRAALPKPKEKSVGYVGAFTVVNIIFLAVLLGVYFVCGLI